MYTFGTTRTGDCHKESERGTKTGKQKFLKVQHSTSQQCLLCHLCLKAMTMGEEHANGLVCNS